MGQRLPRANYNTGGIINADLVTYGQAVVDGLTAAVATFPTPTIDLVSFQSAVNNYSTALAASIDGSLEERQTMRVARQILRNYIRVDGQYVNEVVWTNIALGASYADARLQIISSGYTVSTDPSPIGPISQAIIRKFSSPAPGQLYVLVEKLKGARTYSLQYGDAATYPIGSTIETFPNTRILKVGLDSGDDIMFQVFGNGASGITTASTAETQVII